MRRGHLFALVGLLVLVLLSLACGSAEPQARSFDLEIAQGKLSLDPPVIKVNQDDKITLRIRSDEEGEFHLHGYDLDVMVIPGEVAELAFTADATGKFDFELHPAQPKDETASHENEEEEEHILLGSLEVHPR